MNNKLGRRTTVSTQDNHCKVPLASIFGKRLDLAFDGGILTSDSGALLLREVEAKTGILSRIIEAIKDRRHPSYVAHSVADLVKQRVFQIACGYEDANDCDALCSDPGFKAAVWSLALAGGRLEQSTYDEPFWRIRWAEAICIALRVPLSMLLLPRIKSHPGDHLRYRWYTGYGLWDAAVGFYSMGISMLTPTSPCIFMRGNRVS